MSIAGDSVSSMTQTPDSAPLAEVIGRAVRDARRKRGEQWTQERLSEQLRAAGLDWSRNVVANLESGRLAKIDVRDLIAVALALGVTPLDLLAPDTGSQKVPETEVWPGTSFPPRVLRLWLMGADPLPWSLFNSWRGEAEETLARKLAEDAFVEGASLRGLREDLAALPTPEEFDRDNLPPEDHRKMVYDEIQGSLRMLQKHLDRLKHIEEEGPDGND